AALPPSSSTTFFLPARAFMSQPTSWDPVKLSSFKRSSVINTSEVPRSAGKIEKAPLGKSVSASTSPINKAPSGVALAGLSTKGQPAAMAGATLCAVKLRGKLKGEIKAQGPMGTRRVKPRIGRHTSELQSRFDRVC